MEWNDILIMIVESLFGLAMTAAGTYLTIWLNNKVKNDRLNEAISDVSMIAFNSVTMVKQTFVDSLKKEGKFDAEAQKVAFNMALTEIEKLVNKSTKDLIVKYYGDFEDYITNLIETNVAESKKEV